MPATLFLPIPRTQRRISSAHKRVDNSNEVLPHVRQSVLKIFCCLLCRAFTKANSQKSSHLFGGVSLRVVVQRLFGRSLRLMKEKPQSGIFQLLSQRLIKKDVVIDVHPSTNLIRGVLTSRCRLI